MINNKLYREDLNKYKCYFVEAANKLGVDVEYRYITKRTTEQASGENPYSKFSKPEHISVVIESGVPKVESLKQLGWFFDVKEEQQLIDFPIMTPNLQEGCRIKFISEDNNEQEKEYEVKKISSELLFPTCRKCLCVPVHENETSVEENGELIYGQQFILSDEENNTFINEKPKITFF